MKFTITYDVTITHQIEIEASDISNAMDIAAITSESDVIQDLAEHISTADISGAYIDKVSIIGENGSEIYY